MLGIFGKKMYLKDLLSGFVDIHNHLLPGIDDGAKDIEESMELISRYKTLGINKFIATPHVMNDYYPNTPKTINAALDTLRQQIKERGIEGMDLRASAEYMMDQSFLEVLKKKEVLPLYKEKVLVEMSFFQPPINLNEILFQTQASGYHPILAHPERYAFFHSRKLEKYIEMKNRGCYFQLNLLSLVGHYGKHIQETAFALLDNDMIDYVGTDTHQHRHLDKLVSIKLPQKRYEQLEPIFARTTATFQEAFN